jgi:hypothetical protein
MANVDPRIVEYLRERGLESPAVAFDLEGLRRAQEEEAQVRHMQDVGRAGEMASAAVRGRAPDYSAFRVPTAVKDFLERQGLLKAAAAEQSTKAATELAAQKAQVEERLRGAQIKELESRPEREAAKLERTLAKEETDRALRERSVASQEEARKEAARMQAARLGLEQQRLGLEQARLGVGGGKGTGGEESSSHLVAKAIAEGRQPPDLKGLYRMALPVKADLERMGFNLSKAQIQWDAQKRLVSSLNGPQQTRLGQATRMVQHSLDKVEELYKNWQREGIASEFPTLNKADLAVAIQQGGKRGAAAQALTTLINDLILEQATVLMGGNAPTEQAMHHAEENLQAQWGGTTFEEALRLVKFNANMRSSIMKETTPNIGSGSTEPNPYTKKESTEKKATHRFNPETGRIEVISGE